MSVKNVITPSNAEHYLGRTGRLAVGIGPVPAGELIRITASYPDRGLFHFVAPHMSPNPRVCSSELKVYLHTREMPTDLADATGRSTSDGSSASYYDLPAGATRLQDLISDRNMNAQDGEMFRAIYRKGRASHSGELRDAKKVLFYANEEVKRLEALRPQEPEQPTCAACDTFGNCTGKEGCHDRAND